MKKKIVTYILFCLTVIIGCYSCYNNTEPQASSQGEDIALDLRPLRSEWDLDQWKKFRMLCDNKKNKETQSNQIQLSGYCDCIATVMIEQGYKPEDFNKKMLQLKPQISNCLIQNIKK